MKSHVEKTVRNLISNNFEVEYFEQAEDFKTYFINSVNTDMSIGIGGSKTIQELGIYDALVSNGNEVYWHWKSDNSKRNDTLDSASKAMIYLSSANGITHDGKIVCIDGLGNRVSSLCYGHNQIYIVVGVNKISTDVINAIHRIKTEACPQNAERLNLKTPCRYTKECSNCKSEDRMCNITCIIEHQPMEANITVCIINETLGF